jgi:hypothetical protein
MSQVLQVIETIRGGVDMRESRVALGILVALAVTFGANFSLLFP